jgi:beta-glucanase (GH16 family)
MPERGKPTLLLAGAILLVTLVLGASSAAAVNAPLGLGALGWDQVFDDEFGGSSLDTSKWYPSRWFAVHCEPGATPGEMQYYTDRPANVSVSGGYLHLIGRDEPYRCPEGSWAGSRPYTSGWVQTGGGQAADGSQKKPGFTMGLGYVEARLKLPPGKALWSAFWMLPVTTDAAGIQHYESRPEIDGLEVLGDSGNFWRFNVHFNPDINWNDPYDGPDTTAGWHTIGVWRKADSIEWYADGQHVRTYDGPGIPSPDVRLYLILNLVVGGDYPGTPDASTPLPAEMLVDYVRAWTPASLPPASEDEPPFVGLTAPRAGSALRSTVSAAADASDDHGVSSVEFWLDSRRLATDHLAPYAADAATPANLASGPHTLSARTVDGQGLSASSAVTVYRGGSSSRSAARRAGRPAYRARTSGSDIFLRGPARHKLRVTLAPCGGQASARSLRLDVRLSRKGRAQRVLPGSRFCVTRLTRLATR